MTDVVERLVPFSAGDGLALNLINVCGTGELGPVLLVHGAGVRANLFRPPVETTFVDVLVDAGYDVWLENWRASGDVEPNNWTMDEAAVHDHPFAVRKVVEETGCTSLKAVIHCQGATTFSMSVAAGLVPEVDTIICSAVSLHTVVPWWSRMKLLFAMPVTARVTDALDPSQDDRPRGWVNKLVTGIVKLTHRECDVTACRMVSFTYGAGYPALWRHEHLNQETHETWIQQEFTRVPVSFFLQMRRCVRAGQIVSEGAFPELPERFCDQAPKTEARIAFFTGEMNRCFLPESQRRSYAWFDKWQPGRHSLHVMAGYSHLDLFMGKTADTDVFPLMLAELADR